MTLFGKRQPIKTFRDVREYNLVAVQSVRHMLNMMLHVDETPEFLEAVRAVEALRKVVTEPRPETPT